MKNFKQSVGSMYMTLSDLQTCFYILDTSNYKMDWVYLLALSVLRCKGERD